jgi:hypothetical protein
MRVPNLPLPLLGPPQAVLVFRCRLLHSHLLRKMMKKRSLLLVCTLDVSVPVLAVSFGMLLRLVLHVSGPEFRVLCVGLGL